MDDKAKDRFKFKAAEVTVTFIPQCANCKNNLIDSCKVYGEKPEAFRTNKIDCPGFVLEK